MKVKLLFLATVPFIVSQAAWAGPTAFQLAKMGDKYVGEQSKDRVVQIRSERSVGSLTPDIWYVVYYDPDATFKSVQVKFGAGREMSVTHPWRVLEMASNAHKIFNTAGLKVDSDKALSIATSQPLLKDLKLKSTQLFLMHTDLGPEWKVQLWAAKLDNSGTQADIGVVVISATDGSVVQSDLHPEHVQ
ncbi:MAG: hypothetical protein KGR98_02195 [Verrucomicrobia bacterium]|nr:hypothetical protein [Verrucomicrobiota bacterium]MDE3098379.1 hypothetical protein [Verrucomicrobiota bacterium]